MDILLPVICSERTETPAAPMPRMMSNPEYFDFVFFYYTLLLVTILRPC